jgi:hypothetical protein
MNFLEVDDLRFIGKAEPPKTREQIAKDTYEEVLKSDEVEINVPQEQREKTIKCLMKVMDYQLQSVKEQAD